MRINRIGMIGVISFCFLMIFPLTCKSPTSPDRSRVLLLKITGVIADARTGLPIKNAWVWAEEWIYGTGDHTIVEAKTNQEGRYNLEYERDGPNCRDGLDWVRA